MTVYIQGIRKTFQRRGSVPQEVLRGVDLTVGEGEFVSLIGHSGCGKSTLLNVVGGLVRADAGQVLIDSTPVTGPGPDRAFVFQNYSLLPRLSMLANVREAVRAAQRGWTKEKVDEMTQRYLTAVGLWEHRDKRPGQVSGGMAQRAAVARAFAVSPRILLLDEPFGALDSLTRSRLQRQLLELWGNESDTETVLMVTHGLDEATLLADRIVVMANAPHPSVRTIIDVPIARPRSRETIAHDPHWDRIQAELERLLSHDQQTTTDPDPETVQARRAGRSPLARV